MVLMSFSVRLFFISSTHRCVSNIFYAGEVIKGYEVVEEVEKLGTAGGTPKSKVIIADSGVV